MNLFKKLFSRKEEENFNRATTPTSKRYVCYKLENDKNSLDYIEKLENEPAFRRRNIKK